MPEQDRLRNEKYHIKFQNKLCKNITINELKVISMSYYFRILPHFEQNDVSLAFFVPQRRQTEILRMIDRLSDLIPVIQRSSSFFG